MKLRHENNDDDRSGAMLQVLKMVEGGMEGTRSMPLKHWRVVVEVVISVMKLREICNSKKAPRTYLAVERAGFLTRMLRSADALKKLVVLRSFVGRSCRRRQSDVGVGVVVDEKSSGRVDGGSGKEARQKVVVK